MQFKNDPWWHIAIDWALVVFCVVGAGTVCFAIYTGAIAMWASGIMCPR